MTAAVLTDKEIAARKAAREEAAARFERVADGEGGDEAADEAPGAPALSAAATAVASLQQLEVVFRKLAALAIL